MRRGYSPSQSPADSTQWLPSLVPLHPASY